MEACMVVRAEYEVVQPGLSFDVSHSAVINSGNVNHRGLCRASVTLEKR